MYALCVVPVILYVYKTAWEDSAKDIAISMDVAGRRGGRSRIM